MGLRWPMPSMCPWAPCVQNCGGNGGGGKPLAQGLTHTHTHAAVAAETVWIPETTIVREGARELGPMFLRVCGAMDGWEHHVRHF